MEQFSKVIVSTCVCFVSLFILKPTTGSSGKINIIHDKIIKAYLIITE